MPDRWRNSGGGKGSSDLPKGSAKPAVRRRYGAVVPAAPIVANGSNQRKLKKEKSLRYYEYTLLEHKANANVRGLEGNTPLHHAALEGHVKAVRALMQADADVNIMNDHKLTSLHMAFMGGHHDCVKLLMERASDDTMRQFNM